MALQRCRLAPGRKLTLQRSPLALGSLRLGRGVAQKGSPRANQDEANCRSATNNLEPKK